MPGNTFGNLFRVTTWGESHGQALGAVVDGCPPGFSLTEKDIQKELDRRKPGQRTTETSSTKIGTSRKEEDKVRILSGIFEGWTLGTPILLMVENRDQRPGDYSNLKNVYRPGHADYSWDLKYGLRDYRGGGRASGRETVSRVMAGAIARKYLFAKKKTRIIGHTVQIGPIKAAGFKEYESDIIKKNDCGKFSEKEIEKNAVRCADPSAAKKMEQYILNVKAEGDSVGGIVEIIVRNTPPALGEPVFDKLQADLGKALFSIAAVKGVEFGEGFGVATLKGSQNNDELISKAEKISTKTNRAGGICGGISIGTDLIIRIAVKPTASIALNQQTVTSGGKKTSLKVEGRHDACIIPRLIPVAESMVAITLMDHYLRQMTLQH